MSLGLKLLTMTRFYRPLPTTPDICIRVPSTCTCWPLSPATTTWYTRVPVFTTLSRAVQSQTGLQRFISYCLPGTLTHQYGGAPEGGDASGGEQQLPQPAGHVAQIQQSWLGCQKSVSASPVSRPTALGGGADHRTCTPYMVVVV